MKYCLVFLEAIKKVTAFIIALNDKEDSVMSATGNNITGYEGLKSKLLNLSLSQINLENKILLFDNKVLTVNYANNRLEARTEEKLGAQLFRFVLVASNKYALVNNNMCLGLVQNNYVMQSCKNGSNKQLTLYTPLKGKVDNPKINSLQNKTKKGLPNLLSKLGKGNSIPTGLGKDKPNKINISVDAGDGLEKPKITYLKQNGDPDLELKKIIDGEKKKVGTGANTGVGADTADTADSAGPGTGTDPTNPLGTQLGNKDKSKGKQKLLMKNLQDKLRNLEKKLGYIKKSALCCRKDPCLIIKCGSQSPKMLLSGNNYHNNPLLNNGE